MAAWLQRYAWPVFGTFSVVLALAYAFWPRAVEVDVATVARAPLAVTIDADGVTRVREVYVISAPVSGRVRRIEVHSGDEIHAGSTVLARIEPADPAFRDARAARELELGVAGASAARDLAAATLAGRDAERVLAQQDLRRTRELAARGIVARAALDRAEAEFASATAARDTARAALRQREFEVRTAAASLMVPGTRDGAGDGAHGRCCLEVRSPIDGRMLRLLHENEGVVQTGEPLAEVGDPAQLEIVADLLSSDAVRVNAGDAAVITRWGGEGSLAARVRRVEPVGFRKVSSLGIEEQRVNVILDFTDPPARWQRIGHGYELDVAILQWQSPNVLRVPVGALFRDGTRWAVFLVRDGVAQLAHVALGHMNDEYAEVLSGLVAGDQVITHPGENVGPGARVAPRL